MKIILINENGIVRIHKFFPAMGGSSAPTNIEITPGEAVMLEVEPGVVTELQREPVS